MNGLAPLGLLRKFFLRIVLFSAVAAALPAAAQAQLQCAPYAREVSGIDLYGRAGSWWSQAEGHYRRGQNPELGAVLTFRPTSSMPAGHVAVVSKIIDARHVQLNHANWSRPGMVERQALAEDVSDAGDWSKVRVWYAPIGDLGLRANPVQGFIYPDSDSAPDSSTFEAPVWASNNWKPGNGLDVVAASLR